jgi:hypothetical protein
VACCTDGGVPPPYPLLPEEGHAHARDHAQGRGVPPRYAPLPNDGKDTWSTTRPQPSLADSLYGWLPPPATPPAGRGAGEGRQQEYWSCLR